MNLRQGVACLLAELLDGPATHVELVAQTGMVDSTVRLWVQALRAEGVVRVAAWERYGNGGWKPVYGLNLHHQPDAPKPPKMSDATRQAKWRKSKRLQRAGLALAGQ